VQNLTNNEAQKKIFFNGKILVCREKHTIFRNIGANEDTHDQQQVNTEVVGNFFNFESSVMRMQYVLQKNP
jgi:hypothetical protein